MLTHNHYSRSIAVQIFKIFSKEARSLSHVGAGAQYRQGVQPRYYNARKLWKLRCKRPRGKKDKKLHAHGI